MIDLFYKLRFSYDKPQKVYIFLNILNSIAANIFMPLYYKLDKNRIYNNIEQKDNEIIISLTSYGKRINTLHICIESLLRQKFNKYKVILWLSREEFESTDNLPKKLKRLINKGLEIRLVDDIKSYKKIYYVAREFSTKLIVTADDDFIYPSNWLDELVSEHRKYPNCLICHRAHGIKFDKYNDLISYGDWDWYSNGEIGPSHQLHPLTGAGVLYPIGFFDNEFFNLDVINRCCPTTDDLWTKVSALRNNIMVKKVRPISKSLITINESQKESLIKINQALGNDNSLKNLISFYNLDFYDLVMKNY